MKKSKSNVWIGKKVLVRYIDANWDRGGETAIQFDLFGEVAMLDEKGWATAVYGAYVRFRFPTRKLHRAQGGEYLWETTRDIVTPDYLGIVRTITDIHGGKVITEWSARSKTLAEFKRMKLTRGRWSVMEA